MDAILYLLIVGIGGMILAAIAILTFILLVAFIGWSAIRSVDELRRVMSKYPQDSDRVRPSSYTSLRLRGNGTRRLRGAR